MGRIDRSSLTSGVIGMDWLGNALDRLADQSVWGYRIGGQEATEPTAWTALALSAHGLPREAQAACRRLAALQAADGSLGIAPSQNEPCWPTGLAVLAWCAASLDSADPVNEYRENVTRAVGYILALRGETLPPSESFGHDTSLAGWPWVAGTHSWVEPTAISVLALKVAGQGGHERAREGVRLLADRLLPSGGCNYGNTVVLGQRLRPHLHPSGLALMALAGESDPAGRAARTLDYVEAALSPTTAASLASGLMGLAAHARWPARAAAWLESAAGRPGVMESPYRLALLAAAALGERSHVIRSLARDRSRPPYGTSSQGVVWGRTPTP